MCWSFRPSEARAGIHNPRTPDEEPVLRLHIGESQARYVIHRHHQGIIRRVHEHKLKLVPGFSAKYGVDKLVYFEIFDDPTSAISREKQLKKWRRDWKIALIEAKNPGWIDLAYTLT
jgi:putative endonuclease